MKEWSIEKQLDCKVWLVKRSSFYCDCHKIFRQANHHIKTPFGSKRLEIEIFRFAKAAVAVLLSTFAFIFVTDLNPLLHQCRKRAK